MYVYTYTFGVCMTICFQKLYDNLFSKPPPIHFGRPYLRLFIVGAAESGERRQTNRRRRLV